DDLRVLVGCGPLHAGEDRRLRAALQDTDLGGVELRVRCHALVPAVGGGAAAGDRRRDVGTVPDVVEVVAVVGEVLRGEHPAGEVRVGRVDAGVDDRDRDPGP